MIRKRLHVSHQPTVFGMLVDYTTWPIEPREQLMHALFFVAIQEWGALVHQVRTGKNTEYRIDWVAHRISLVTGCGIVHVEPDPKLSNGNMEIDVVLRGGLTYEDCVRQGEQWMDRAVEIRGPR